MFAVSAALCAGTQALIPATAAAMIDQNMTEDKCNQEFGIWHWFDETCELNFGGGGGGGPAYGGVGGGGGGSAGTDAGNGGGGSGSGSTAKDPGAEARDRAEKRAKELEAELKRVRRELAEFDQSVCKKLRELVADVRDEWLDGTLIRVLRGGSKEHRIQRLKARMQAEGCRVIP